MWFIGVEVEQETSAPPPKKILDPPLLCKGTNNQWSQVFIKTRVRWLHSTVSDVYAMSKRNRITDNQREILEDDLYRKGKLGAGTMFK